jgi:hypothetical protein
LADGTDVQPLDCNVIVNVYVVPADNPVNVAVDVLPTIVAPPGLAVTVQLLVGRLLSATLPVATVHVGGVIVPIVAVLEVTGWAGITAFAEAAETQPVEASVVVKV